MTPQTSRDKGKLLTGMEVERGRAWEAEADRGARSASQIVATEAMEIALGGEAG